MQDACGKRIQERAPIRKGGLPEWEDAGYPLEGEMAVDARHLFY